MPNIHGKIGNIALRPTLTFHKFIQSDWDVAPKSPISPANKKFLPLKNPRTATVRYRRPTSNRVGLFRQRHLNRR